MPTFKGQVTEEQVLQRLAYIKSLSSPAGSQPSQPATRPSSLEGAQEVGGTGKVIK